jgi:hypothetical protein
MIWQLVNIIEYVHSRNSFRGEGMQVKQLRISSTLVYIVYHLIAQVKRGICWNELTKLTLTGKNL